MSSVSADDLSESSPDKPTSSSQKEVRVSKRIGKNVPNSYVPNMDTLIKAKIQERLERHGGFKKTLKKRRRRARKTHRGRAKNQKQKKKEKSLTPAPKKKQRKSRKTREREVPFTPVAADVETWDKSFKKLCSTDEERKIMKDEIGVRCFFFFWKMPIWRFFF